MIGDEEIYNILFLHGRGIQEDFQDQIRVRHRNAPDRGCGRRLRPLHQEDHGRRRRSSPSTGRAWPRSSSRAPAWPAGKQKLSTRFHYIADVIREADYWARQDGEKMVGVRPRRPGHPGALRTGQPDRAQDPGDDRGRLDSDRYGRGPSSARSTAWPCTAWANWPSASRAGSPPGRPSAGPGSSTSSAKPS